MMKYIYLLFLLVLFVYFCWTHKSYKSIPKGFLTHYKPLPIKDGRFLPKDPFEKFTKPKETFSGVSAVTDKL